MDNVLTEEEPQLFEVTTPLWRFRDILGILFVGIFILAAGGVAVVLAFDDGNVMAGALPEMTLEFALALIVLEIIGIGAAVGIVGVVKRINWGEGVWLRPMSRQWWGRSVLIGLVCIPIVNLVSVGTQLLFQIELDSNPQLEMIIPDGFSWVGLVGMTVTIGLFVPFVEELFFRGVLLTWLWGRFSFLPAALISSVVFGLVHGEIYLITATAVLGFVAAWTMRRSGSLWSAVVIHAMNNALQVVIAYLFFS